MAVARVQMTRSRPWRVEHPDAVIVARPTRWGNPFVVGMSYGASGPNGEWHRSFTVRNRADAADAFRRALATRMHPYFTHDFDERVLELAGRDLACWCPLDQPCHADVLLELANGRSS